MCLSNPFSMSFLAPQDAPHSYCWVNHFFHSSWFLLLENGIWKPDLGTRCDYCYQGVTSFGLFRHNKEIHVVVLTHTHTHIHIPNYLNVSKAMVSTNALDSNSMPQGSFQPLLICNVFLLWQGTQLLLSMVLLLIVQFQCTLISRTARTRVGNTH